MTGVLLAVLSALLYGTGVAFEHRKAADTPASTAGRPRLVLLLLGQPLWLVGAGCEVSGFAAHCVALGSGSLAVVQMLLSGSLIVSVAISSRLHRRRLTGRSWLAVFAVVIGVGGSVALLGTGGHASSADSSGRLAAAAVLSGLVAAPVVAAAFLARGRSRPLLLGFAAGLVDASIAVITMAFSHVARHGLAAIATSWPTYALIVGGLASVLVTQTAYQADRPLVTLPVIAAVMPLASLLIGATVLGETAHFPGVRVGAVVACVMVAVIGLVTLARAGASRAHQDSAVEPVPRDSGGRPACVDLVS
jgi:hypothetical protein